MLTKKDLETKKACCLRKAGGKPHFFYKAVYSLMLSGISFWNRKTPHFLE